MSILDDIESAQSPEDLKALYQTQVKPINDLKKSSRQLEIQLENTNTLLNNDIDLLKSLLPAGVSVSELNRKLHEKLGELNKAYLDS